MKTDFGRNEVDKDRQIPAKRLGLSESERRVPMSLHLHSCLECLTGVWDGGPQLWPFLGMVVQDP
jgi:hypothetical protein